ncbi:MAG: ABC transporter ATP-binding protein [Thermoproteota archaeon]
MNSSILTVKDLLLYYRTSRGLVKAVDRVSLSIERGKTLAVAGESGCGKSSLARAITRLLPRNVERYAGSIILDGENIMKLKDDEFASKIRWRKIAIVPQAAMNSLNPVMRVIDQIIEPLVVKGVMAKEEAIGRAIEVFRYVGIPKDFLYRYSFELSGGMKQRVCIAMALIANPQILILDEPTSALDVLTQANIMNILKQLKEEAKLTFIFITHDVPLSSELADVVSVMYAGEIVEISPAEEFYIQPKHPYAKLLLSSVPTIRTEKKIISIPGTPPSLIDPPPGCRFHPRCPYAADKCRKESPPQIHMDNLNYVKCWLYS